VPGTTDLALGPTARCCHWTNLSAWCQSHCPSTLKFSWREL